MATIGYFVGITWLVFWIYWFIAAAASKSQQPRSYSSTGVIIRFGIFIVVFLLIRTRAFSGLIADPVVQAIGLVLFVAGLALAVWARLYLGRNWGMPMSV